MAKCLVTGGAGFIGAHVNNALLAEGHETVVLDDLSGGFTENVDPRSKFIKGSILDVDLIQRLFREHGFQRVYHLAAYAAEGLSHFIKRFNYNNNLIGSVNLINASVNHEVECFVFTSSIAVYGPGQLPMTEDMTPTPEDSYGVAKYAVELELKATHEMFGLDYVIFRPHNVYGELQNIGDRYRNVIGIFMNQVMQGKPLSIFGDGEQTRAFSYIGDMAPIIARSPDVAAARNEIFNVGADKPYTVNELAKTVCDLLGAPNHPIIHHEARNEVKHAYSDHAKASRIFGEGTNTDLRTGLERMANWAKKVGARKSGRFGDIEIPRGLPPFWLAED